MIDEELQGKLSPLQQAVILRLWDITSSEVTLRKAADGGVICHLCRIPQQETTALRESPDRVELHQKLEDQFSLCLVRNEDDLTDARIGKADELVLLRTDSIFKKKNSSDCILLEVWGKTVDDALSALLLQLGKLWSGWHLALYETASAHASGEASKKCPKNNK